jgi:hypothetical protein
MVKLKLRLVSASTLLEVVVSMVIIMAVFSVAIGIYTKVTMSGLSISKATARQHMNRILHESIENGDFQNAVLFADSVEYKKTVLPFTGYSDLTVITIQANQEGRSLGTLNQIVKASHEN